MSDIFIYTTEDGQNRIELQAAGGTVWLTQSEIVDLFATTKQNVSLHVKNIREQGRAAASGLYITTNSFTKQASWLNEI